MTYCDAHCHISSETLPLYVKSTEETGEDFFIKRAVNCVDPKDWEKIGHTIIYTPMPSLFNAIARISFGYHPHNITGNEDYKLLEDSLEKYTCTTIAEAGLDYACDVPKDLQKTAFKKQLDIAVEKKYSVVLHLVKAHEDALEILSTLSQRPKLLLHAANCSQEIAKKYLELGVKMSFGLRELNSPKGEILAKTLSLKNIMLETDGENFDFPALRTVYHKLYSLREEDSHIIATKLKSNFEKFFCDMF